MHLNKFSVIIIALIFIIVMGCAGIDTAKKTGKDGAPPAAAPAPASSSPPVKPGKSAGEVTGGREE
ncbi:MAG: hypothetical protein WCO89_08905, partial [Syntrophus sp. (in: bacteria)]